MSYRTLKHHNGNLLAAIDLETTGTNPGYHDICQVAVQPLTVDFEPHPDFREFACYMKPQHPERAEPAALRVNGLSLEELELAASPEEVEEGLVEWFDSLGLAFNRRLIPVAHNFPFESSFLKVWLGIELYDKLFLNIARDSMVAAAFINDMAAAQGTDVPFARVNLEWLCDHFKIDNPKEHDALCDAIAGARLYGALTKVDVLL